jgi:hypothetical protein
VRDYVHCLALRQTHFALLFDDRREESEGSANHARVQTGQNVMENLVRQYFIAVHIFVSELYQLMGGRQ